MHPPCLAQRLGGRQGLAVPQQHHAGLEEEHSYVHKWGNFASDKPALYLSLLFFWSVHSSLE